MRQQPCLPCARVSHVRIAHDSPAPTAAQPFRDRATPILAIPRYPVGARSAMTVEPVSPPSSTVPAGDAAARPAARTRLARRVLEVPPSGIRKFFDVLATMPDVISLGVGEP